MKLLSPLRALACVASFGAAFATSAATFKLGLTLNVQIDGSFLAPTVSKICIKAVEKPSLADDSGILAGDEITQVEGQTIAGRRATDVQELMKFGPGETKTFRITHTNGQQSDVRISKPKE